MAHFWLSKVTVIWRSKSKAITTNRISHWKGRSSSIYRISLDRLTFVTLVCHRHDDYAFRNKGIAGCLHLSQRLRATRNPPFRLKTQGRPDNSATPQSVLNNPCHRHTMPLLFISRMHGRLEARNACKILLHERSSLHYCLFVGRLRTN